MIKFAHPLYLYALILVPVFIGVFIALMMWRRNAIKKFGERRLVDKLIPSYSRRRPTIKFIILMLAWIFLVVGVADPLTGSKLEQAKRKGIDVMIALDVSNSMLAEDIAPNRLANAKQVISKLINKLEGDRIGIVVFAGKAFLQLPLTTDYGAAKLFLSTIDTRSVGVQGTAIGEALTLCQQSFDETKKHSKVILLITDGENHEDNAVTIASEIGKKGTRIFAIGMGSVDGAPIPEYNKYGVQSGYKTDRENNTVITRLDPKTLEEIAANGDGSYVRASNSRGWFSTIFKDIDSIQKGDIDSKKYIDYEDQFQYFIFIAILLLIIELFIFEKKSKWAKKLNIFNK
ncbi:MAG: VWA domain-containing protein [Hyphomicrobiales bacterium]